MRCIAHRSIARMAMASLLVAVLLVLLGVGVLVLVLCGPTDARDGIIGRAFVLVSEDLPRVSMRVLRATLGNRVALRVERAADWVFNKPNPLIQYFYVTVVVGAITIFGMGVWPLVLYTNYVSPVHIVTVPITIVMLFATYLAACFTQPGFVTSKNVDKLLRIYPYDHIIFKPKECETCLLPKPARSKHCSYCGRCIARFDHHCVWINGCVGANNMRYFVAWLLTMLFTVLYGTYLIAAVLLAIVREKKLYTLSVLDETGQRIPVNTMHVLMYLLSTENLTAVLGIFLTLVSLVLLFFIGHHLYLVWTGVTTNEMFKWDELKWHMNRGRTVHIPDGAASSASSASSSVASPKAARKSKGGPNIATEEITADTSQVLTHPSQLYNIYHRGPLGNFYEALVPPARVFS